MFGASDADHHQRLNDVGRRVGIMRCQIWLIIFYFLSGYTCTELVTQGALTRTKLTTHENLTLTVFGWVNANKVYQLLLLAAGTERTIRWH